MSKAQLEVLDITGIKYNMISKTWYLSDNVDVNYMICFKMTDKFIKKK